jgi:hypothetical protein
MFFARERVTIFRAVSVRAARRWLETNGYNRTKPT